MGLDGPPPDARVSPFDNGFVCIVRPFGPLKNGPPCLSHVSRWVAPPICARGHPSGQPIKTPFAKNLQKYCL